ncbi:hypothetical protein BC828DRAFT_389636 [Blastocladiella britannica]|nr:hypothetical protein BC828DRAFT_389636 [Blastocladiella britannica]
MIMAGADDPTNNDTTSLVVATSIYFVAGLCSLLFAVFHAIQWWRATFKSSPQQRDLQPPLLLLGTAIVWLLFTVGHILSIGEIMLSIVDPGCETQSKFTSSFDLFGPCHEPAGYATAVILIETLTLPVYPARLFWIVMPLCGRWGRRGMKAVLGLLVITTIANLTNDAVMIAASAIRATSSSGQFDPPATAMATDDSDDSAEVLFFGWTATLLAMGFVAMMVSMRALTQLALPSSSTALPSIDRWKAKPRLITFGPAPPQQTHRQRQHPQVVRYVRLLRQYKLLMGLAVAGLIANLVNLALSNTLPDAVYSAAGWALAHFVIGVLCVVERVLRRLLVLRAEIRDVGLPSGGNTTTSASIQMSPTKNRSRVTVENSTEDENETSKHALVPVHAVLHSNPTLSSSARSLPEIAFTANTDHHPSAAVDTAAGGKWRKK